MRPTLSIDTTVRSTTHASIPCSCYSASTFFLLHNPSTHVWNKTKGQSSAKQAAFNSASTSAPSSFGSGVLRTSGQHHYGGLGASAGLGGHSRRRAQALRRAFVDCCFGDRNESIFAGKWRSWRGGEGCRRPASEAADAVSAAIVDAEGRR